MIEYVEAEEVVGARIKVIGMGGGGGNAVDTMIKAGLRGVEFIAANTDAQSLSVNHAPVKLRLGETGLGAGAKPEVGREAAEFGADLLRRHLTGADMVFVTAGMGGGTGTGGAPVVGRIARELGVLTVGVVTRPFKFEGPRRSRQADEGIKELRDSVDTLIVIPNQRLLAVAARKTSMMDAFRMADDVLFQAVRGIADLISVHGHINLDFADVRTVMQNMGMAIMGSGTACGTNRAVEAAQRAVCSPLLEDISIRGAKGVLINVTGGPDLSIHEIDAAASLIQEQADEDAHVIFGAAIDETMGDEVRITVIATGFPAPAESLTLSETERLLEHLKQIPLPAPPVAPEPRQEPEPIAARVIETLLPPAPIAAAAPIAANLSAQTPQGRPSILGMRPGSLFGPKIPAGNPDRPIRRLGTVVDGEGEPRLQRFEPPREEKPARREPEFVLSDLEEESFDTPAFLRKRAR